MVRIMLLCCLLSGCGDIQAGVPELSQSSETKQMLQIREQCSIEELAFWDSREQACTGRWHYTTYDCFEEKETEFCGVKEYKQNPVIGVLTCEHPDHGVYRWGKAATVQRTILFPDLYDYQALIMEEAENIYGPNAIAVFRYSSPLDFDRAQHTLSYRSDNFNILSLPFRVSKKIDFKEIYYHMVEPGEWEEQATHHPVMAFTEIPNKQDRIMRNAEENLSSGFGRGIWPKQIDLEYGERQKCYAPSCPPCCVYGGQPPREIVGGAVREIPVEVTFYKPIRYHSRTNPACGEGIVRYETDTTSPIYNECRHESHGRARKNECDASEQKHISEANLKLEELPEAYAYARKDAICSTGDSHLGDFPFIEKLRKFQEIMAFYTGASNASSSCDEIDSDVWLSVNKKAKYFFERYAGFLPILEQKIMDDIYDQSVGVHACGTSFLGHSPNSSIHLGQIEMCHRLTLQHASTQAIHFNFERCLPQESLFQDESPVDRLFYLNQLVHISYKMLEQYIYRIKSEKESLKYDDVQQISKWVDMWYEAVLPYGESTQFVGQSEFLYSLLLN